MQNKNILYVFFAVVVIFIAVWFIFFRPEKAVAPITENPSSKITYTNASNYLITVDSPSPNATVSKNFKILGQARGMWYFEASFPVELRDQNGNLLNTSIAKAQGDWMTENFVPFIVNVVVPNSYVGPATLVLKRDNPSGEPANDASISFPITIQ